MIPYFLTPSTSGLELFKPTDRIPLVGNDLRLPDQGNGHSAHDYEAKNQGEADMRLANLTPKDAANPFHGWGSPSTAPCEPTGLVACSKILAIASPHTDLLAISLITKKISGLSAHSK